MLSESLRSTSEMLTNADEKGARKKKPQEGSPAELRGLFSERLETLARACQDIRRFREDQKAEYDFNIAPDQKLIMCKTAKHGTTTWSYNFIQILLNG